MQHNGTLTVNHRNGYDSRRKIYSKRQVMKNNQYKGFKLSQLKGVLFDLDNTLVSCSMSFVKMRTAVNCPEGQDILTHVNNLPNEKQRHAQQTIIDIEVNDAHKSKAFKGATELLSFLKTQKIPTAIITRNCEQAARIKLDKTAIDTDILITREHFPAKPDPSALQYVAQQWRNNTSELLFVGDYRYDLEAAFNAQMPSCLVHQQEIQDFTNLATFSSRDLVSLKHDLKPFIHRN